MRTLAQLGAKGDGITNDTAALQAFLDQGGTLDIPPGSYVFDGPLLYSPGMRLTVRGKLLYREGWTSAYAMCPRAFVQGSKTITAGDVVLDFRQGGGIQLLAGAKLPRKGLGLINIDGVQLIGYRYQGRGGPLNLFALEGRSARNVTIVGADISNETGSIGGDGIKISGDSANWDVSEIGVKSTDDALSFTQELFAGAMSGMRFRNVSLQSAGYSAVKVIVPAGGSVKGISVNGDLKCLLGIDGQGAPIWIDDTGGEIDGITIAGIKLRALVQPGGKVGGTFARVIGKPRNVVIAPAYLGHFHRTVLDAPNAPGLQFKPGKIEALAPIPVPGGPMPLVSVAPDAAVTLPTPTLGYKGQQILARAVVAPPAAPQRLVGVNLGKSNLEYNGPERPWLNRLLSSDISANPVDNVYQQWGCTQWQGDTAIKPEQRVPLDARLYPASTPPGATWTSFYTNFPLDGTATPQPQRYVAIYNKPDLQFLMPGKVEALSRPPAAGQLGLYVWDVGSKILYLKASSAVGTLEFQASSLPFLPTESIAVVRYDELAAYLAGTRDNPAFMAKLARFGAIRFMDWLRTNSSPFASYGDLPRADGVSYSKAVPVSICCDYANKLGVDAELPVPHQFDDASVDLFVTEIRDTLKGRYSCALSNEAGWQFNAQFMQGPWFNDRGKDPAFVAKLGNDAGPLSAYGYRAAQVMQRAIKVFGAQRARLVTNLGFQLVTPGTLYYRKVGAMLALRELGATPKDLYDCGFDVGQVTWYFGLPAENDADRATIVGWAKDKTASGLDNAFRALADGTGLTTTVTYGNIKALAAMFADWGKVLAAERMRLEGYEGGHAMGLATYTDEQYPWVWDLRHRMRADDRMADAYGAVWDAWTKAGGGRGYQFTDFAAEEDCKDGDWFTWQKATDPESPVSVGIARINGLLLPTAAAL